MFIVEIQPARDPSQFVDQILQDLAFARWRGVDCRLVIGGSRDNKDIAELSMATEERCKQLGVQARWLTRNEERGSHAKFVLADEYVLVGSHNWSPGTFGSEIQDAVLVRSGALASLLESRFLEQWRRAAD